MAETEILSPEKRYLANPIAGCPMANKWIRARGKRHIDYTVVAYINTTELKLYDVCITSSSAVKIVIKK